MVAPQLPVKNAADLIAYGKANPGKLNFASAGIGTTPHLAGELFKQRTGIDATHVPYREHRPVLSRHDGEQVSSRSPASPARCRSPPTIACGRSPPPGSSARSVYPDLPTVDEAGLKGFEVDLWLGIFAPAGLPPTCSPSSTARCRRR